MFSFNLNNIFIYWSSSRTLHWGWWSDSTCSRCPLWRFETEKRRSTTISSKNFSIFSIESLILCFFYKTGLSKYTNFHDENRQLRPIARRTDLAVLQVANDLLRVSKDHNDNDERESNDSIPKLPRLAPIPPIMSRSSTSSAWEHLVDFGHNEFIFLNWILSDSILHFFFLFSFSSSFIENKRNTVNEYFLLYIDWLTETL